MYDDLLKIQEEIGAIKKDSENPFYKSAYFDINSLLEVVKPVLNRHKVVLLQGLTHINGKLALSTKLISCGSDLKVTPEIEFICPIPDCADPQKYGSAITYFRRYALQSLLALKAEDDDGNSAKTPTQAPKTAQDAKKPVIDRKPPSKEIQSPDIEFGSE